MKRLHLIFLFLFALLISSCTKHQYVSLKSDLPKEETTKKYFIDKDSVRVTFSLEGNGFSVGTSVHNFSSRDLFVDLESSTFVRNGRVVTNFMEDSLISINSIERDRGIFDDQIESSTTKSRGRIEKSESVVFIPPGTYASFTRSPFTVEYSKDLKRKSTNGELSIDGRQRLVRTFDLADQGDEFKVMIRMARSADLEKMQTYVAAFREDKIYTLDNRIKTDSEIQARNYYTSRTPVITRVVLGTGVLVSLAMFYAFLETAGDSE
jgi:hypothetical protein